MIPYLRYLIPPTLFNNVAQPEDSIGFDGIFSRVGPYDEWAIEWGCRWFPELDDAEEEKNFLNNWVIASTSANKFLWFGNESNSFDPRTQSEDLGDDPIKASFYGIKHLKRTADNLIEWTTQQPGEDFSNLANMYEGVFNQFKAYLFHVSTVVGGVMLTLKTKEQPGPVLHYPSKFHQKQALQFLHENIFSTPHWILNDQIYSLTGVGGVYKLAALQRSVMEKLLSQSTLGYLLWWSTYQPEQSYTPEDFLNDLEAGIWEELRTRAPIDLYRRNLQKIYVNELISLLSVPVKNSSPNADAFYKSSLITDISSIVRQRIRNLISKINKTIPRSKDTMSKSHLIDLRNRLKASNPH